MPPPTPSHQIVAVGGGREIRRRAQEELAAKEREKGRKGKRGGPDLISQSEKEKGEKKASLLSHGGGTASVLLGASRSPLARRAKARLAAEEGGEGGIELYFRHARSTTIHA